MAIFTAIGTAFATAIGAGAFIASATAFVIGGPYIEAPDE